jgi:hypothetical protein
MGMEALRNGTWATAERVRGYLLLLAGANLLFMALAICRANGWIFAPEKHFSTEFASFYAAGRLADMGQAASIYAPGMAAAKFIPSFYIPAAHKAMEVAIAHDPQVLYFSFFYPPVFLLLCAAIATLPYVVAYLLWVFLSGGFLAWGLQKLLGGWGKIWPALAFTSVIENAGVGENAFWSTGLLAAGLSLLQKRPLLAGACFGALCYKPHFLLPIVIFLAIGGQWRALIAAGCSAALLCLASALAFGWPIWVTFLTVTVPHANWVFAHGGVSYGIQVTPKSAILLLHGRSRILAVVVDAAGIAFAIAALLATARASPNIRAAALCASYPLLAAIMLHYDDCIAGLAIVFLWREAHKTGFLPWEKTGLAALFILPLITQLCRTDLSVPIDPLIPMAFLLLLWRRAAMSGPPPAPQPAA